MQEKILKNQVVAFGQFNFPPVPETSLALLQNFAKFGFMPVIAQQTDVGGQPIPRMALMKGDSVQIVFSNDRIDFIQPFPEDNVKIEIFLQDVFQYLDCLQDRNLRFNRLALVNEKMIYNLSHEQKEALREQFAAYAPAGCIEWTSRWVAPETHGQENFNVCLDCSWQQGVFTQAGKHEMFEGVKIMNDISHSTNNTSFRFYAENLRESYNFLLSVMQEKIENSKPKL